MYQLLLRATTGNALVLVLIAAVGFLVELVLARVLGKSHYGVYVYAVTIVGFATLAARAGIDLAVVRFIPEYAVQQQWGRVRGLLRLSQWLVVSMSTVMVIAVVTVIEYRVTGRNSELADTLYFAVWLIPGMALGNLYQASARAFKVVVWPQLVIYVLPSLLLAATVYTFSEFTGKSVSAAEAAMYKSAWTMVGMFALFVMFRVLRPVEIVKGTPTYLTGKWVGTGIIIFSIMIMTQVINQTDTMMIGSMINTDTAGIYNAAYKISLLATFPLLAVNMISAPLITELHASDRKGDLQNMLRKITGLTSIGTVLIVIVLLVLGEWLLSMFGQDFTTAYFPLCIMLAGQVFISLSGPLFSVMVQTGQHRPASVIMLCTAILNVMFNALLIPRFGMLGAATASTCALIIQRLAASMYTRRHLGLDTSMLRLLR